MALLLRFGGHESGMTLLFMGGAFVTITSGSGVYFRAADPVLLDGQQIKFKYAVSGDSSI